MSDSVETKTERSDTDRLVESLNKLAEAVKPQPLEPVVTQSTEAAIQTKINEAREHVNATDDAAQKNAEIEKLREQLAKAREELAAKTNEAAPVERKAEYDIGTIRDRILDAADVAPSKVRGFFDRIVNRQAALSDRYKAEFGYMKPRDVLVNGYFEDAVVNGVANRRFVNPGDACEEVKRLQGLNDKMLVWRIHKWAMLNRDPGYQDCPLWDDWRSQCDRVNRAIDTTDFANFVPYAWSAEVLARYELQRRLTAFIKHYRMTKNPEYMPVWGARQTVYQIAENTADSSQTEVTASDPTDLRVTLDMHRIGLLTRFSYDVEEDALINMGQQVPLQMAKAMTYAEEDIICNSDSAGTHMDTDITGSTDVRRTVLGLRAMCVDNSYTTDLSTFTVNNLIQLQRQCGIYGSNASEGLYIISPRTEALLMTLVDSNNNPVMLGAATASPVAAVQTLDTVPKIFGRPVVIVEAMRENLSTDGTYDGTTVNNTCIIYHNREAAVWAYVNEAPTLEVDRDIEYLQAKLVMSQRREFEFCFTPTASHHTTHLGIDVATS